MITATEEAKMGNDCVGKLEKRQPYFYTTHFSRRKLKISKYIRLQYLLFRNNFRCLRAQYTHEVH